MEVSKFYKKYFQPGIVTTDSRKISSGCIFIALRGERFNGNQYAMQAIDDGAEVAVIDDRSLAGHAKLVKVDDSLKFLQELANYHRKQCTATFLGLTGSNGKTTTKELIASVLSTKMKVQATKGNLNNHIGVPLTLLEIKADTEIAIIEMGANHPGEIDALCRITEPDCGLITNIGKAHLEGFGGFEGVKKTKAELYNFVKAKGGTLYFNGSDEILNELIGSYKPAYSYQSPKGLCSGQILSHIPNLKIQLETKPGNIEINSSLFGEYNLTNVLAASCVALHQGLNPEEIKKGVEQYIPQNMRSQILQLQNYMLILDCYNANPTSMRIALTELKKYPGSKKIAILGGMKELGAYSAEEHVSIAQLADELNLHAVITTGQEFQDIAIKNGTYCKQNSDIIGILTELDLENSVILIKGSRANKLEEIGDFLKNKF